MFRIALLLAAPAAFAAAPAAAQGPCGETYTVTYGDTLYSIAQRCRTEVAALMRANPMIENRNRIEIGWELEMPGAANGGGEPPDRERPPAHDDRGYEIRPGDTLWSVAARLGLTVADLLGANPGLDPRNLGIGDVIALPGRDRPPSDEPAGDLRARVRPDAAAPGEPVTLIGRGFRPNERVRIGAGPPRAEYSRVGETRADAGGRVRAEARVPDWARPGRELVWVLHTRDGREAFARGFEVIEPDGRDGGDDGDGDGRGTEVTGVITNEGVECPALRGEDGRLYTLAGDTGRFGPGDRVTVRGPIAEMSFCMQGTTIEVRLIRAAGQ